MLRRVWSSIGAILLLVGLLTGCGTKPVVGVLLPTTGEAGAYGESLESGVRLALADARKQGQLPDGFEVVWADTGSEGRRAISELHRVISERGVKFVIGGATSEEARALLPELDKQQVVCLSPSASLPSLTKDSKMFYRIYPSDELEGATAGKFLHDRMNRRTALLFVADNEYTRGIEPEFVNQYERNLGGKIVHRVALTDADWKEQATRANREQRPESAYIIAYAEETLEALRHLRDLDFTGTIVTTSAFDSTRVIEEAGEAAEGVIFPLPPFDRTSEKEPVLGFVQRYMDTYQRAPDILAAHGYDAMCLAIQVMTVANPPQVSEIKKALQFGIKDYMGVTGPILFDDYGDVKHYPKMYIVDGGQVMSYQRYMKAEKDRILREVQQLLVSGRGASPTPTP
jgi:branched-chain amino acid transport system substrate-binding protein